MQKILKLIKSFLNLKFKLQVRSETEEKVHDAVEAAMAVASAASSSKQEDKLGKRGSTEASAGISNKDKFKKKILNEKWLI